MKVLERRHTELGKRLQRKRELVNTAAKQLEEAKEEARELAAWMEDLGNQLGDLKPIGHDPTLAEQRLHWLKAHSSELEGKQTAAEAAARRAACRAEFSSVEPILHGAIQRGQQLRKNLDILINKASNGLELRRKLALGISSVRDWIRQRRDAIVIPPGGYLPLKSSTVESDLNQCKKHENDIKNFCDNSLSDITKQANALLKDCSEEDQQEINAILEELNNELDDLKKLANERGKAMADLLEDRLDLEKKIEEVNNELNNIESSGSSLEGIPQTEAALEDRTNQLVSLSKSSEKVADRLKHLRARSEGINPTLSEPDRISLIERIDLAQAKHGKLAAGLGERLKRLAKTTQCAQLGSELVHSSNVFVDDMVDKLANLNKPCIGKDAEDVRNKLGEYEKILEALRAKQQSFTEQMPDAKGALISDGDDSEILLLPEHIDQMAKIRARYEDFISEIEKQIGRLKQLLLIREQFMALVAELTRLLAHYSGVVNELERSDLTGAERIGKYDELIGRIQECEALLASAEDKGRQVSEDAAAADRNAVAEQLHGLKTTLANLRTEIEMQRSRTIEATQKEEQLMRDAERLLAELRESERQARSRPQMARSVESVEHHLIEHDVRIVFSFSYFYFISNINLYLDLFINIIIFIKVLNLSFERWRLL